MTCDDAISRQAVLEKAVYTETEEGWCGYTVDVDYIKSLPPVKPQEPSRDMEEIAEVLKSDADADTKCKMISNILLAKPHYFELPSVNTQDTSEDMLTAYAMGVYAEREQTGYEWKGEKKK